jgi:hypothetical protein
MIGEAKGQVLRVLCLLFLKTEDDSASVADFVDDGDDEKAGFRMTVGVPRSRFLYVGKGKFTGESSV